MTPTDPPSLPARYRGAWEEFEDWCTALALPSRPVGPDVVAAYLAATRGRPQTQRGRVTAINAAHRLAGYPEPGRAEAVRQAYNPARAARRARTRRAVDTVLAGLPEHGWVRGLFGRRDAALLTLAGAGLSFPRLVALRQEQTQITDTTVVVDEGMLVLPADPDQPQLCPVQILRRWAAVTNLVPLGDGHALLAERLTHGTLAPADFDPRWAPHPVVTAFDAYGRPTGRASIGGLHPLHATAAAAIASAHLSGNSPQHRDYPRPAPASEPLELDPNYYERGVDARQRTRPILDELDDLLDDLEARIQTVDAQLPAITSKMSRTSSKRSNKGHT